MKLLFCPECQDVIALTPVERTCKCGSSYGSYRQDKRVVDVYGEALVIVIDSLQLERTLKEQLKMSNQNLTLAAWIMSEPAENVVYHRDE